MGKEKRRKEGEGGMIHLLWPVAFDSGALFLCLFQIEQSIYGINKRRWRGEEEKREGEEGRGERITCKC